MMRLFCDLDGVLVDLEDGFEKLLHRRPSKVHDDIDWADVMRQLPDFFRLLQPTRDAMDLWRYIKSRATILTGCPALLEGSTNDKEWWVRAWLGQSVPIICCRSRNKWHHCRPGDVLIDDWEKHRSKWEAAGGLWITHTDAASTIDKLKELGL